MPIKFTGKHRCDHCGNNFEWNYFEKIRSHISASLYNVDSIPIGKCYTIEFNKNENGSYDVVALCPKCRKENRFVFFSE